MSHSFALVKWPICPRGQGGLSLLVVPSDLPCEPVQGVDQSRFLDGFLDGFFRDPVADPDCGGSHDQIKQKVSSRRVHRSSSSCSGVDAGAGAARRLVLTREFWLQRSLPL